MRAEAATHKAFCSPLLFSSGGNDRLIAACVAGASAVGVDSQALDLLIERGKGNLKQFRCFGLIPARAFEHVADNAALDFVHDLKQRRERVSGTGAQTGFARESWDEVGEMQSNAAYDFLCAHTFGQQID